MLSRRAMMTKRRSLPPILATLYYTQTRELKNLTNRTTEFRAHPIEQQVYQLYNTNPKAGGDSWKMYNTHYDHFYRTMAGGYHTSNPLTGERKQKELNNRVIDWMMWGKTLGQAFMPQRHQRVVFDHHDKLHPTKVPRWRTTNQPMMSDSDRASLPFAKGSTSKSFNPYDSVFSEPEHANRYHGRRRPQDVRLRSKGLNKSPNSRIEDFFGHSDTHDTVSFGNAFGRETKENIRTPFDSPDIEYENTTGRMPGVNVPYKGEPDGMMMEAMSTAYRGDAVITTNEGRFSTSVYLNAPTANNALPFKVMKHLRYAIDSHTNGFTRKMVVLKAAQSGLTDHFCAGLDFEQLAFAEAQARRCLQEAAKLEAEQSAGGSPAEVKKRDVRIHQLKEDAAQYSSATERSLRESAQLLWKVFTAPKPLLTLINGRCSNVGNGLALLSQYPALRDSSEFCNDGSHIGLTPYGGLSHLLARDETTLKYPGLAEFITLTGTPLYAGDALRLGWSDMFSSAADVDYHIKNWFDNTEHLFDDAVAWQVGTLVDKVFRMNGAEHRLAMERTYLTPQRARWIEDTFADQQSVSDIVATLTAVEKLPFADSNNTSELSTDTLFNHPSVELGVASLAGTRLQFAQQPWDGTDLPPELMPEATAAHSVFRQYFFENVKGEPMAIHSQAEQYAKWREFRLQEFKDFQAAKYSRHPRHVFVRLEGPESTVVDFPFDFDKIEANRRSPDQDEDGLRAAMLEQLKKQVRLALRQPDDRELDLGWCLPTLETCPIWCDADMFEVLQNDPGVMASGTLTEHPPVYLVAKRVRLHFSEWAFAVKHQLLLACPTALAASFQMIRDIKCGGVPNEDQTTTVQSVSESLATEFRYMSRLMSRPDFFAVGHHTTKSAEEWDGITEDHRTNLNEADSAVRPTPRFDEVFERDVEIDGHKFLMRPKWSPRTLDEIDPVELAKLGAPLSYTEDNKCEMDVRAEAKQKHVINSVEEVGVEFVARLGEKDSKGKLYVQPTQSDVHVPTNVDFYSMNRHPWLEHASSWRQDGFTKNSEEYFHKKALEAEEALYDPKGVGAYNYWPTSDASEGKVEDAEQALLKDRFWDQVHKASDQVEGWAKSLRQQAETGNFNYRLDPATTEERIYDDEYYKWFITPGESPNPSGILRFGDADKNAEVQKHLEFKEAGASWPTDYSEDDGEGEVVGGGSYGAGGSSATDAAEPVADVVEEI